MNMYTLPPIYIDRSQRDTRGVPMDMLCPITREVMRDPVILRVCAADGPAGKAVAGERFERHAIEAWLANPASRQHRTPPGPQAAAHAPYPTSPCTRRPVAPGTRLQPDVWLRQRINRTLKRDTVFLATLTPAQRDAIAQAFSYQIPKHHAAAQILASSLPQDRDAAAFLQDILRHCLPRLRPKAGATRTRPADAVAAQASAAPRRACRAIPFDVYFAHGNVPPGPPFAFHGPFCSLEALGSYVFAEFQRRGLHDAEQARRMRALFDTHAWYELLEAHHVRFHEYILPAQRPVRENR